MTAAALPIRTPAPFFEQREWIARAVTAAIYVAFLFLASHFVIEHEAPRDAAPIAVTLADPPAPEAPTPPEIKPTPQPVARAIAPRPTAVPTISTPIAASPSPSPAPVTVPDLPVSPVAREIPKETPTVKSDPGAEGRFAQEVRSRIEKKKIFPVTARELGMTGTVEVMYVLDRAGTLVRAEIVASSGYPLLDQAALRAVRSATHSAMPEDAWVGERQKEFRTRLVFSIED